MTKVKITLRSRNDGSYKRCSNGILVSRAREKDVRDFFEALGPVNDVQLIRDRASKRSCGMGYVKFADLDTHGEKFMGFPLLVKHNDLRQFFFGEPWRCG